MYPIAITCGNTIIIKPSEKVPTAVCMMAEMLERAGLPPGILNIIHGGKPIVDWIINDPDIKAVSFVGSSSVGELV